MKLNLRFTDSGAPLGRCAGLCSVMEYFIRNIQAPYLGIFTYIYAAFSGMHLGENTDSDIGQTDALIRSG